MPIGHPIGDVEKAVGLKIMEVSGGVWVESKGI